MKIKIFIILLIMGLCYNIAFIFSFERAYPEEMNINFCCEVIKEKETKDYYDKYIVKVIENKNLKESKNTKLILYVKKNSNLFPGDVIKVTGKFQKADASRNYKGFNYRKYLKQSKIYGIVFAEELEVISQRKDGYFILSKMRNCIENQIEMLYEEDYGNFLKSLLIGNKSELDENIVENFQNANISHILAISGMHISFILIGVNYILEKIINSRKIREAILILFLLFFLALTGCSVSCMRACIMNIILILCSLFYKRNNFYISLIVSFIIIILLNPYNIFSIGMWLSYCGTLGIVLFHDFLYKILCRKLKIKNNIIKQYVLKSFCLSVSAQILILPIMLYVFNNFSLTFFISNIITSIFIGYVLAFGYISVFISFIYFPISKIISCFEKLMIFIIFKTANIVSKLQLSKIYVITPNFIFILLYYFALFGMIIYFKNHKFKILKFVCSQKYNAKLIKEKIIYIIKACIKNSRIRIILVIFIIIVFTINSNKINFKLQIYFIDVGQGDCTLIVTPLGKRILIDGGEGNSDKYDYGKNVLFPYLLDRGIKRIDYLVVSHADSDHIGGLIYILENMEVKNILIGYQPESSRQLKDLIKSANKKKVKIHTLGKGDIQKIEKSIELEVLWPEKNEFISENMLNNNSLVLKLKYNNFSMIFTGDIEEVAEKAILNSYKDNIYKLKSTILKSPHHGSKTSSSQEFISKVSPQAVLIGVGKNNNFGHPNDEVINRLEEFGIKIYRTDQMGEISITVTREGKIGVKKFIKEKIIN